MRGTQSHRPEIAGVNDESTRRDASCPRYGYRLGTGPDSSGMERADDADGMAARLRPSHPLAGPARSHGVAEAAVARYERMAEAVDVVRAQAHQNGRWPMNLLHADRVPFDMEVHVGGASRWNTLRALRVLDRYGR
jgi:hypothetical protein